MTHAYSAPGSSNKHLSAPCPCDLYMQIILSAKRTPLIRMTNTATWQIVSHQT